MLRITAENLLAFRLANESTLTQVQVGTKEVLNEQNELVVVPDILEEYLTPLPSGVILGNHFPGEDGWCYIYGELSEEDVNVLAVAGAEVLVAE